MGKTAALMILSLVMVACSGSNVDPLAAKLADELQPTFEQGALKVSDETSECVAVSIVNWVGDKEEFERRLDDGENLNSLLADVPENFVDIFGCMSLDDFKDNIADLAPGVDKDAVECLVDQSGSVKNATDMLRSSPARFAELAASCS